MRLITGSILLFTLFFSIGCTESVNIKSLLEEMSDRENLTYLPEPKYQLKQASSYNRETVAPDEPGWYANGDMSHFVRVENINNRREFVLFDQEGPGAIVRWWMTFWRAENGILRIYLDNDTIPEIEGAPFDVISGQMLAEAPFSESLPADAPLNERGHNLYVPIPFAEHCKITYECDSLRPRDNRFWPDVFYNICYREYEQGTSVETFSVNELKKAKKSFDRTKELLLQDFVPQISTENFSRELQPGDSIVFNFNKKNSAISFLRLEIESSNPEQALRSTVLKVIFDGHQYIWVPVGEFYGTGYQIFPHKTWVNQVSEDGQMTASWIMPYQEDCTISYINYGSEPIHLLGEIGLSDYQWKPNSLYFGACWHEYYHLNTRSEEDGFFDLNYVDITGKGLYIGDQITLFNMANTWWGEGDEKIFVDGEEFPSSIGTGSEDYYGYAFGHPEAFSHPFISQPSGAGNYVPGMTVNMRHRALDAIPFKSSISTNIEMWHWASCCINYSLTSYYYVQFPFKINIKPDIASVQRPVATSEEDFFRPEAGADCFSIEQLTDTLRN